MKVREHGSDPVFVKEWLVSETPKKVELRIGEEKAGETRYAVLTPREAQQVAIALLIQAEASLAGPRRTH
jgi:hypothetical protein